MDRQGKQESARKESNILGDVHGMHSSLSVTKDSHIHIERESSSTAACMHTCVYTVCLSMTPTYIHHRLSMLLLYSL